MNPPESGCRFCGGVTDLLVGISADEGNELELKTKIARHLPVHISDDDGLPQHICYPCVDLLLTWDAFVTSCVDHDARMRSIAMLVTETEAHVPEATFSESDDEPLIRSKGKSDFEKNKNETFVKEVKDKQHPALCENKRFSCPCEVCGNVYKSKANLDRHVEREHKNNQEKCPVCHLSVSSRRLKQHLRTIHAVRRDDEPMKRFKCKLCDQWFNNKYVKNDHFKLVHLQETVKCTVCDFEGLRNVVKRHERSAHTTKRFPCALCSGTFKTLHLLKTHMTAHSDLRCYTCDVCGMGFKRLNNVRDHIKCHQKKSNQCQICGNFFARKRYLAVHEKTIHNFYADGSEPEEKGFECGTCGAKLKWKKNLLAHMRIHSGEKPYGCKICQRGFVCHGSLRTHMSKHAAADNVVIAQEDPLALEMSVLSHLTQMHMTQTH